MTPKQVMHHFSCIAMIEEEAMRQAYAVRSDDSDKECVPMGVGQENLEENPEEDASSTSTT